MKWTPQQDAALRRVDEWLRDPDAPQIMRLFGEAGTGKTTLAKTAAEGARGPVHFGAYTGKAAHVLREKGCPASTIHSLAYTTRDASRKRVTELEEALAHLLHELRSEAPPDLGGDELGAYLNDHDEVKRLRAEIKTEGENAKRPIFTLNQESVLKDAALLVLDEVSMVDTQMGEDLLSFGCKILALGDPYQLPPIMGGGFFTEAKPDIMLTDIQRQAEDNPIIWMARQVRQRKHLDYGSYGDSKIVRRVDPVDAMRAGQILVGRNATRHNSNLRMRELLGRTDPLPVEGDRLVCLRNNHDMGLLNGALWKTIQRLDAGEDKVVLSLEPLDREDSMPQEMLVHTLPLLGREKELPWWDRKEAQEFAYGYALTVHKAQGSQWDDVLLFDESGAFGDVWWRWLYTGLTRAAKTVTVVM